MQQVNAFRHEIHIFNWLCICNTTQKYRCFFMFFGMLAVSEYISWWWCSWSAVLRCFRFWLCSVCCIIIIFIMVDRAICYCVGREHYINHVCNFWGGGGFDYKSTYHNNNNSFWQLCEPNNILYRVYLNSFCGNREFASSICVVCFHRLTMMHVYFM